MNLELLIHYSACVIDHDVCYVHAINQGITNVDSDSVKFEFEGTGPSDTVQVSQFTCTVTDDVGVIITSEACTFLFFLHTSNYTRTCTHIRTCHRHIPLRVQQT